MPDLNRFDFHVNRFMNSYSVDIMDSSEIGQYVLLLCKSWQVGKDCCLPDDPDYLARHAHVKEVSIRVLEKFPIVDTQWGPMRRNDVLFEEWQAAARRTDAAIARVAGRGGKWADTAAAKTGVPVLFHSNTKETTVVSDDVIPRTLPIPYHTESNQTIPHQPVTDKTGEGSGRVSPKSEWRNMAVRHKRIFGSQASTQHKEKYAEFCERFSEDVVLECFDDWAADAKDWVESAAIKQPLFAFWKKLPDMAETIMAVKEAETAEKVQQETAAEKQTAETAAKEASTVRQAAENWKLLNTPGPALCTEATFEDLGIAPEGNNGQQ